jgi:hypothetical protein
VIKGTGKRFRVNRISAVSNAGMLLHVLPGYSPELNPVELLNHDVKANAAGRRRPPLGGGASR